jgi:glycosyltransferase involved in cell wall biosynthesis
MKKAIVLTAYNRPEYLSETLESWNQVRGLEDWDFFVFVDPSDRQWEVVQTLGVLDVTKSIQINPERYGVLLNPWVAFETTFGRGYDFVLRIEDDIVVSDDILEYFNWAIEEFRDNPKVALVQAMSDGVGSESGVEFESGFSPWNWGTWRDRWFTLIGPSWDRDYSTFNDRPGNQAGWDWNLNTRLLPQWGMVVAQPKESRTQHIGVQGTHATPELFHQAPGFKPERPSVRYRIEERADR